MIGSGGKRGNINSFPSPDHLPKVTVTPLSFLLLQNSNGNSIELSIEFPYQFHHMLDCSSEHIICTCSRDNGNAYIYIYIYICTISLSLYLSIYLSISLSLYIYIYMYTPRRSSS